MCSCAVEEKFHFNEDFSGHYTFEFDYSAILEFDTTGVADAEMDKGYVEMEEELKKIDGITNIIILSDNKLGKVLVSYDFDNIEALNQANYNDEAERYDKQFFLEKNKLSFKTDFSSQLEEYKESEMDTQDLIENIESMLDYTMLITFDKKIKSVDLSNFEQADDYSLYFKLNSSGLIQPSAFTVKTR
jgi:hypothetical protein